MTGKIAPLPAGYRRPCARRLSRVEVEDAHFAGMDRDARPLREDLLSEREERFAPCDSHGAVTHLDTRGSGRNPAPVRLLVPPILSTVRRHAHDSSPMMEFQTRPTAIVCPSRQ
jgi:hypothetical protein